jgi:ankyrin repeat protein
MEQQYNNPNYRDRFGNTRLMNLCMNCYDAKTFRQIKKLLKNPNVDVNAQNNCGFTALLHSIRKGKYSDKLVELLLKHPNINPNLKDRDNEFTALMNAARYSGYDSTERCVELLLNHPDTDPNIQETVGYTALMIAARRVSEGTSTERTVEMLAKHPKVDVYMKTGGDYGNTALDDYRDYCREYNKRINPRIERILS